MLINVTLLVKKHKTCKRKGWKPGKKKKKFKMILTHL